MRKRIVVTICALGFFVVLQAQNCGTFKPAPVGSNSSSPSNPAGNGGSDPAISNPGTSSALVIPRVASESCVGTVAPPAGVNGLNPKQLRQFANLDTIGACGEGITVAVIISAGSSDIRADLATYSSAMGLPAPTSTNFQILMPDGSCATGISPLEAHIDVEMVHALAPKANIIMACGADNSTAARGRAISAAIAAGAQIVSMSWGQPETAADFPILEPIFTAHPDVTFFAGSGDSGSNDSGGVGRVAYPASSPEVIAVGAIADDGSENLTAWVNSGGGVSQNFARPVYQNGLPLTGSFRFVPDIAFNGSNTAPTAVYGAMGWTGASGTSVASPIAAGMMAILNQIYGRRLGDIHAKLYALLPSQLTYFRDVTNGNNGDYNALVGYDMLTGLGVPRALALLPHLQ